MMPELYARTNALCRKKTCIYVEAKKYEIANSLNFIREILVVKIYFM